MLDAAAYFDYLSANKRLEVPVKIASVTQAALNVRYLLYAMASPRKVRMKRSIMVFMFAGATACWPSLHAAPIYAPAQSVQTHLAACHEKGSTVNCEVSGVARVGERVVLANDKQMPNPGDPAIFTIGLDAQNRLAGPPSYLDSQTLKQADKYEGLTTTLDGKYVIAITAFNKEGTAGNPGADALNTLLYWPADAPAEAKIVNESTRGNVASSRDLRERISKAVGSPYYQIEALTTAPDDRLLIGVRKYGENSKAAVFSFLLLSVPFRIDQQQAVMGDELEVVWRIPAAELAKKLGPAHSPRPELGLSGIEFDRYNKDRFYAVTSFEKSDELGGYLWVLPYEGKQIGQPQSVKQKDGSAVVFNHKPEGVEVLGRDHVLVVHDDDRVRVKDPNVSRQREAHEFFYNIVDFSTP